MDEDTILGRKRVITVLESTTIEQYFGDYFKYRNSELAAACALGALVVESGIDNVNLVHSGAKTVGSYLHDEYGLSYEEMRTIMQDNDTYHNSFPEIAANMRRRWGIDD